MNFYVYLHRGLKQVAQPTLLKRKYTNNYEKGNFIHRVLHRTCADGGRYAKRIACSGRARKGHRGSDDVHYCKIA